MSKRVLLADDASFMRIMLKNILEPAGFQIVGEASNGREAIELYRKLKPDVFITDMIMPDIGGIDVVKEIIKEFPDANIIICSAIGQQLSLIHI
ncbi:MAG: response regulator, partial [Candidatus Goldbacteria bacterium]|nr:response regulator [Candidatus Goldiibacteriota bacterium]